MICVVWGSFLANFAQGVLLALGVCVCVFIVGKAGTPTDTHFHRLVSVPISIFVDNVSVLARDETCSLTLLCIYEGEETM